MFTSTRLSALATGAVLLAGSCAHPASPAPLPSRQPPPTTATAAPVSADPDIGAVFLGATDAHSCAGAVVHSATRDLIVTAAHCLSSGDAATFVPGFSGTGGPAGSWHVKAVYLDPRWLARQDPLADYAIARVGHDGAGSLEDTVGPGLALGDTPPAGTVVTVIGYPGGAGGSPIGCRGTTGLIAGGYPSLKCAGFVDGTSGAPWRTGAAVVGVIGGLHGGGCNTDVSYSSPFDASIHRLLARAEAGGSGDHPPETFEDDC